MPKIAAHIVFRKVDILKHFHPEWVDGGPGQPGPLLSKSMRDFLVSGVIRDMAGLVGDRVVARELRGVAQGMAKAAVGGLLAGWEEGDDLCPPWRFPVPGPGPHPWWLENGLLDRGELTWLDTAPRGALDQLVAFGVRELASLASDAAHGKALGTQAERLAKAA